MIKILKKDQEYKDEAKKQVMPITHTLDPTTTGASVIGLFYKDGVMIATDTNISYGRLTMYKSVDRIYKINNYTAIASSGEYSDFQEICRLLHDMDQQTKLHDDKIKYTPHDFSNYLARQSYGKRNKMNPLYLMNVLGGYFNNKRYLSYVDLYGTLIESTHIVTGYANYFCKPIIWNYWNENVSEAECRRILEECFKILFYRDSKAGDRIQLCIINAEGVRIEEPIVLETKWDYQRSVNRANEKDYIF